MDIPDKNTLSWAGNLAFFSAFLGIISIFFVDENAPVTLETGLSLVASAITIYLLDCFKTLLHQTARFEEADPAIRFIIRFTVVLAALQIFMIPSQALKEILEMVMLFLIIPYGIFYAMMGMKLLKCQHSFNGYLQPYAYLLIITGVSIATIIFALIGFAASIFSDMVLGMIFLSASKQK